MALKPRTKVPALTLPLVGGGTFELARSTPRNFTLLVAYRGLQCPICKTYLRELDGKLAEFEAAGVAAVAISADSAERAGKSKAEWGISRLPIAHDLPIDQARAWGLYISNGIKEGEPAQFSEPGLFLIRPDQTLYAASIQTMPFARPGLGDVLAAVKFVTEKDYPARGEA